MKKYFSILSLLSVIAFLGVSAPAYENSVQTVVFDDVGVNASPIVKYDIPTFFFQVSAILETPVRTYLIPAQNPVDGLNEYGWQKDERLEINRVRSNC